ncbi:unnamed protein product [Anisakis simplex]|uniref:Uncharacterized protein n=1 Tax=Anisakis simplex TaxID=6269 RepID=A0A3P6NXB0_ANISI|nr:unnamed protein product [Anisakis simplex]
MGHNMMVLGPTMNFIRLILPMQCNFIMTQSGISNFRIDSKLDAQLKTAYSKRQELSEDDLRNIVVGKDSASAPNKAPVPWSKETSNDGNHSPLEDDSLDIKYDAFDFR